MGLDRCVLPWLDGNARLRREGRAGARFDRCARLRRERRPEAWLDHA